MLNIVLFEPRIAGNVGNIIRLVAGTGARLHLVEPLGFQIDEPKLRRAGLDYHDLADVEVHPDLTGCLDTLPGARVLAFTTHGSLRHDEVDWNATDALLFGPEPTGLPQSALSHPRITEQVRIPMLAGRRSMNLSNAVAVANYAAWGALGFAGAQ